MTIKQSDTIHKFTAWVLSLCTLLVTGCFVFLWNIHAELAVLQEKGVERDEKIANNKAEIKLLKDQEQNLDVRLSILETKIK